MPIVDINLGSRTFQLACGEGQESHLKSLAKDLDKRVQELAGSIQTNSETLILVMAALMLQDELNELQEQAKSFEPPDTHDVDVAVAETLETVAEYVEAIAERVKKA
ncbi:MAG: cell division protein ZapA [Hyphomicrobiales bacterium]|nr:cell division protein ZapA [Rickettsiales bacterium]MCP5361244.1 cell division protein ZapA [Hyphomicrobiales bacterium]